MKTLGGVVLGSLLLVGCGGGGGGSSSSGGSGTGNLSGLPDPGGVSSTNYDPRQLRAQTTFSNSTVTGSTIVFALTYEKDATRLMSVDDLDEIEVLVDGTPVVLTNMYGFLYSYDMPANASSYEVSWKRDGEVIASTSFDGEPAEIPLTTLYDGSGVQFSWVEQANTTYRFVIPGLTCTDRFGNNEHFSHWENDDLSKNVVEGGSYYVPLSLFNNFTEDQLRATYQTCFVSLDVTGEHHDINIRDSGYQMKGIAMGSGVELLTIF
ncbi:hypothetical protein [Vibrio fortis]|uniref:hypothetical protein n=1 Tax=Vibrio fortis TaxID=212667 RepID=UPI0038CD5344